MNILARIPYLPNYISYEFKCALVVHTSELLFQPSHNVFSICVFLQSMSMNSYVRKQLCLLIFGTHINNLLDHIICILVFHHGLQWKSKYDLVSKSSQIVCLTPVKKWSCQLALFTLHLTLEKFQSLQWIKNNHEIRKNQQYWHIITVRNGCKCSLSDNQNQLKNEPWRL